MKKSVLRFISVIMAVLMAVVYLPAAELESVFDIDASALVTSDVSLGGNVKWKYDSKTKTVTVYGSGAMKNFSNGDNGQRWDEIYKATAEKPVNKATKIVIENGVTSIGNNVFRTLNNVTSVTIPNTVTSIGQSAFEGCSALTTVNIPSSVKTIGNYAFKNTKYASVTIPSTVTSIGKNAFDGISGLKITCDYGSAAHSFCKTNAKPYKLSSNLFILESALDAEAKQVIVTVKIAYNVAKLNAGNFTLTYSDSVTPAFTQIVNDEQEGVLTAIVNNGSGKVSVALIAADYISYAANATECLYTLAEIRFDVTGTADTATFSIASDILLMNDARTSLKTVSGSINLHKYTERTDVVATCKQEGKTITECSICGISTETTIPKNAANHEGGTSVSGQKDATCGTAGYTGDTTCNGCSAVITKGTEIPATEKHTYKSAVTAPTCTDIGFTTYTCTVCKKAYTADEVAAKGHSYESTVTPPTCTENGFTTYKCTVCDHTYTDSIVEAAHTYETLVTAPTCTEKGFTTYKCTACDYSYNSDETDVIPHEYNAVVTAPTCQAAGFTTYTCKNCEHSYIGDETDMLSHNYNAVVTAPTCTDKGFTTYTCTACSYSYVADEKDIISHDYKAVVTAPTCQTTGYTTYTCKNCGNNYKDAETAVADHSYEMTVTKAPTCTEKGSAEYKCAFCDNSYTEEIPVTEHDYSSVLTAPTCTEKGYTTYTCACGNTYTADETPALGHNLDDAGKCTVCGFESITTVVFDSDRFIVTDEAKAVISKDSKTVAEFKAEIKNGNWTVVDAQGNTVADDELMIPGYVLKNENSELAYTVIVLGDANRDGTITASDARKVLRITAELDEVQELDDIIVDCDFNERTTASDARIILRVSADLQTF